MFDILKVELEDFRSFKGKHVISFHPRHGLYAITGQNLKDPKLGPNGVGKSTILEAIHWCNYGYTSRGLKAGDIINWQAKHCAVTVVHRIGSKQLTVKRTQSPNSLTLNDKPIEQKELQKHLRLGPEAFGYAVISPQFGDAFFDLSPSRKLEVFTEVMELDYWLDKSKTASDLATELTTTKEALEREVAKNRGQLETITADIEDLEKRNKNFAEAEKQRIERLRTDLKKEKEKVTSAEDAILFARKALKNLEIKLAKAKTAATKCPTCGQPVANKDLDALLRNQGDFERQLRGLEREKDAFARNVAEIKGMIDKGARTNPYKDQIEQKIDARATAKNRIKKLKAEIEGLDQDHAAVSFWVQGFKRVRLFIVEQTLRQLEIEINNSLASLGLLDWQVELDVERENKSGGITKGFTVLVHAPGAPGPVRFEAWSGGETQRLRLAGNMGLGNLIMEQAGLRSSIEFYDEPSRHLSQEGMLDLADTLQQRALDTGKRIWVIEHNLLDYSYADILTVLKDKNGSHIEGNSQ